MRIISNLREGKRGGRAKSRCDSRAPEGKGDSATIMRLVSVLGFGGGVLEVNLGNGYACRKSLFARFHLDDFWGTSHFTVSAFNAHLIFYRHIPILGREIKFQ